jgi:hypothetical protein
VYELIPSWLVKLSTYSVVIHLASEKLVRASNMVKPATVGTVAENEGMTALW